MTPIFHIVDRAAWADAVRMGTYAPPSLATEGFVHFSFAHQVLGVYERAYRDIPNLVVVEVDPSALAVRVEDSYGEGVEFPHVYQAIPTSSAIAVHELDEPLFTGPATTDR